jgi:hypothetical protein
MNTLNKRCPSIDNCGKFLKRYLKNIYLIFSTQYLTLFVCFPTLFRNFTCVIYNLIVFTQNYILIPRVTFFREKWFNSFSEVAIFSPTRTSFKKIGFHRILFATVNIRIYTMYIMNIKMPLKVYLINTLQ